MPQQQMARPELLEFVVVAELDFEIRPLGMEGVRKRDGPLTMFEEREIEMAEFCRESGFPLIELQHAGRF